MEGPSSLGSDFTKVLGNKQTHGNVSSNCELGGSKEINLRIFTIYIKGIGLHLAKCLAISSIQTRESDIPTAERTTLNPEALLDTQRRCIRQLTKTYCQVYTMARVTASWASLAGLALLVGNSQAYVMPDGHTVRIYFWHFSLNYQHKSLGQTTISGMELLECLSLRNYRGKLPLRCRGHCKLWTARCWIYVCQR